MPSAKKRGSNTSLWMISATSWSAPDTKQCIWLVQQGFEVKRGKHTAVKGKGQKRFIRFRTLGIGYGEDEIKAVLEGKAKHQPYQKKPPQEQPF